MSVAYKDKGNPIADEVKEVRTVDSQQGDATVQRQEVTTNSPDESAFKFQSLIYALFGLLEALLGIRIVLSLLGANTANVFANFIYGITQPFVWPFQGLFNYEFETGIARLEIETLVAMLAYALLGWFIVRVIGISKKNPGV